MDMNGQRSLISVESALHEFEQGLLEMDRVKTRRVVEAMQGTLSAERIVEDLVVPALERMGRDWESGRLALSQVYMGGRICEELVDVLLPPADSSRKQQPRIAIAVLEDHHLLGKRIVYSVLRAGGFDPLDFGSLDAASLIHRTRHDGIEVLLISTLMLPSALRVRDVSLGLRRAGWAGKIVVGGAPFRLDTQLWQEVSADATSPTAAGALALVAQFAGEAA
jgi:methanogenic corrinoid protein MtbC1